jgi:hypothetical protein
MLKLLLLVSILLTNSVVYSGSQSPVVVLLSDDTSAYTQPMESFTSTIKHKVITYNLHGDIK